MRQHDTADEASPGHAPAADASSPSQRPWIDPRELVLQLIVVFVGLLAALQVDGWKEDRQRRETETVYLRRLHDDLRDYIQWLDQTIPFLESHWNAVQFASVALATGKVPDDSALQFEAGIIYVSHLPSVSRPSGAYTEMVSSGVFARIESIELQRAVSKLFAAQATMDANFQWWRAAPQALSTLLNTEVEFYHDNPGRVPSPAFDPGLQGNRVRYDFEALRRRRDIRNAYVDAADTHADWVEWTRTVRQLAGEADAIVARELASRGL